MASTVKLISREPAIAASIGGWPSSMRRMIASITTIASSTTSPTAMVRPSRVTLSMP